VGLSGGLLVVSFGLLAVVGDRCDEAHDCGGDSGIRGCTV
jgi:hypothetical protein